MPDGELLEVDVSDLAPGETRPLQHRAVAILLCNVAGDFYAVENLCSHADSPLSDAELRGCELECDLHGAIFDVRDGRVVALPAKEPLRSFPVEPVPGGARRVRIRL